MSTSSTSRNTIRKDIQWHQPDTNGWRIIDYDDIVGGIVQWKNILYEQANFAAGQKFGVGSNYCDYNYLTAIFAGIELGGKIIVMPSTDSGKKLIGPMSAWIYQDGNNKAIKDGKSVGHDYAIPWSIFDSFTSKFDVFDHLNQVTRKPDEIILTTTTSGSTGTPRVVEYSHRLFDDIRARSIRIFNLREDDRVLHLSNMHHGGTGGVFFLPSLSACRYHYYFDGLNFANVKQLVELVKKEKITKAMFPNNLLVERFLQELSWIDHDLEIYVNQANSRDWIRLLKQTNVKAIHSLFGSTETLGPIFLNTITRDTSLDHNVLNYGKLLDDFYNVEVRQDRTVVKLKNHYQEVLSDCFVLDEKGNHIFQARANLVRVNDHLVSLQEVNNIAQELMGPNGVIVPDTVTNKIYVAYTTDLADADKILREINRRLNLISPVLQVDHSMLVNFEQFYVGIKISLENIRLCFRAKFNLL